MYRKGLTRSAKQIPAAVAERNRLIRATDAATGMIVVSVGLHFFVPGFSNLVWVLSADLPQAHLDDDELVCHLEAREDGLRWSLAMLLASGVRQLLPASGLTAMVLRWRYFAKIIYCQMIWVPFIVARSLAGKINRDELVGTA